MSSKHNRNYNQQQARHHIQGSTIEQSARSDSSKKSEDPPASENQPGIPASSNTSERNQESEEIDHHSGQVASREVSPDKNLPDEDTADVVSDKESRTIDAEAEPHRPEHDYSSFDHSESAQYGTHKGTSNTAKPPMGEDHKNRIDKTATGKASSNEVNSGKAVPDMEEVQNNTAAKKGRTGTAQPHKEHTGTSTGKHDRARNFGSFYLGVAAAFLVAALGLGLSTLPIFFSIPLSAVLFGIGIWLLSYASLQSPEQPPESGSGTDRHTTTVVVTAVLLVLQTFIMDVFIFTRLGSVQEHQNPVIITWIVATVIETIAAFALIFRHNPSSSKTSPSQDTKEQDTD